MLIYIGEDVVVQDREIVAILNKDLFMSSAENLTSLSLSKNIDLNNVKSIVVTTNDIYYSPFASQTLKKRLYTFVR